MQFPRLGFTSAAEKELAQLREENAQLKAQGELAWFADHPVPAFLVSTSTGKILDANYAAQNLYRYERREMLNLGLEHFRTNTGSNSISRLDLSESLGNKKSWVVKQIRRDGSVFSAEMTVTPLLYQGNSAELVQVFDVSRRVNAELELRHLERRYTWFMENATESIWRFELEVPIPTGLPIEEQIERMYRYGYLAEASKSTARLYGYPHPQAMVGLRLETLLPRHEINLAYLRSFIECGYSAKDQLSRETDISGKVKWFRNSLFGEVEAGLLARAWGSSIDITEAKQLEEQNQQTNQFWQDALQRMQLLAVFVDEQAKITYVNPYFVQLTGWQKEEILGKSFFEAFSPEFQSLAANFGKQLQANKLGPYCSNTFTTKEGKKLYLQWNNTIIHDSEGKPIGMFSLGEDITQKQKALEALRDSEEQYRRITEGIPLALYRSTPDGRILYGNRVLAELMNIQDPKQLESINLQTTDTGPTYNRDEFNAELEKNGEIIGLEYQWKRPNQEPRWVRENARAIRDATGKVLWYEGTLEDITDTKIAQEKLVQSEELYRKLSETAPIGILLTRNAVVQHANPFVAQLLGYDSSEELVGKPILDFVHPSDRQYVLQTYIQTPVEPFKQTTEERRLLRKDGSAIMIQAFISQLMVNRQRGSIIVIRDISSQRQSEQEMRRWQQRMLKMQKLESLGLLAGGMAHDFNNQLTVILGHASLLEKQLPADDQLHKLLKPIELAAKHATHLCQQMLSFAGRGKIETHQVNLTQLIQNSEALLKIALGKRADLVLELDPDLPTIQAEEAQIRQVLINLIANSADSFTTGHRGHVTLRTFIQEVTAEYPKMEVTLELPPGKYICLDVIDDGCGMETDSRRRIFEPFFTTKPTGRGLGLPLVLGIVRSHHGAIEVNSKLRQGTSIRIFLPLEVQAPPAVPEKPASATILVVDDELSLRSLASQVLRNHGFRVLEAEDGHQACELVQKTNDPIQLVLVDLTMPVMDGVETLKQIWARQPNIPAIAMSSYGHVEIEDRCKGLPLKAILPKPFTPLALEQMVTRALYDYAH